MKNQAPVGVVLVILASFTCLTATGLAAEEKSGQAGKTEIKDDFIVVHPGTKLSKADAVALNDVLKHYDKSLYKIEIYKNGKVTKTMGTLNDMYIDQKTVADFNEAKKAGQSERAIQLIAPSAGPQKGAAVNPIQGSPAPPGPQMPSSPAPSGPQMPTSPAPSGPQMPSSPTPSGPHMPGSPVPSGPQKSPSSPVNPQKSSAADKQTAEFMERLKPILEKYSK